MLTKFLPQITKLFPTNGYNLQVQFFKMCAQLENVSIFQQFLFRELPRFLSNDKIIPEQHASILATICSFGRMNISYKVLHKTHTKSL